MLKVRVMPTLLYREPGLVKGEGFDSWRTIGTPMQSLRVYNMRRVDELVFLDIAATGERRSIDFELIDELADECFMPFTVGGGVRTVDDVRRLLHVGADRVAVNTAAAETPDLIRDIAACFGSQCVVASIDARREDGGGHQVYTRSGSKPTGLDTVGHARRMEELGAGEILLTCIERDGTLSGYDIDLVRSVSKAVSIPVIASGGAGSPADMHAAITEGGASAVAAAAMFHFTEQTPLEAKRHLHERGIPVRLS